MKKIRIFSIVLLTLLLCSVSFIFTSCKETIQAPESLIIDSDTLILNWRRVPGASSYEVDIEGEELTNVTKSNYISLEYLDPGVYEIKVRAISHNEKIEPSEWSVCSFEKKPESGLRYKLINNRTEYQLTGIGTASGDVVMESEYRGKPVTSIAEKALTNVQKITSIVISKNVREIGNSAFAKCNDLLTVTFEEGSKLESIGEYAFQSCKGLDEVVLPDSLTVIPGYIFSWCSSLKQVYVGENTVSIGAYAFSNCVELETINFPESLSTIGDYAFSDCVMLDEIAFGDSLESIAEYAFCNCSGLSKVDLGEGLKTIGVGAFGACTEISEIAIPDSVTDIGLQAFYNCISLEKVTLGTGLRSIGGEAFYNTPAFVNSSEGDVIYIDNWAVGIKAMDLTAFTLKEGTVGIADYAFLANTKLQLINLSGVKYVGSYAFYGCVSLMSLICDDALLSIGDYAFAGCILLGTNDIKLGASLHTIGNYAFEGCSRITETNVDLPETLRSIGTYAFHNTKAFTDAEDVVYIDDWAVGLKEKMYTNVIVREGTRGIANYAFYRSYVMYSFELPDSIEYIGRAAFSESMYVSSINLPKNLKEIGDYAFYSCILAWFGDDGITVIPEGTEYVGVSAFNRCAKMVGVVIPGTVKTIGDFAFFKCESLGYVSGGSEEETPLNGKVVIEEGVETIGMRVFHGCNALQEIVIPDSVTSLGSRVFYQCESLKKVVIGNGLEYVPDYTFYGCTALVDVKFSEGVKVIGKYAFRGCIGIRELVIGEGIEEIGDYAFYGCAAIRDIVVPRSVTKIGKFAFRGCKGVSSVILPDSVEFIGIHAFYGLNNASIFCEDDTVPSYWNERWNTSYRPVFWGCELSENGKRVLSFVMSEDTLENMDSINGLADPYLEGYYFNGWSTTPDGNVEYSADTLKDVPNGTVLYPVFVESDYFIYYDSNKPANSTYLPEGVMLKAECLFANTFTLAPSEYSLIGWTFMGWSTTPDGSVEYLDGEEITEPLTDERGSTVVLYAVWEAKTYTIKFEANKPDISTSELFGVMPDLITTFDQTVTLTPNQFSIQGWRFMGWSSLPFGAPMLQDQATINTGANEDEIDNATLYAIWVPVTYYIEYNVNLPSGVTEWEGVMKDLICNYDTASTITNEYLIDGYNFIGWATSPDGNVVYREGDEVINLTMTDGDKIVLYAVWQKI